MITFLLHVFIYSIELGLFRRLIGGASISCMIVFPLLSMLYLKLHLMFLLPLKVTTSFRIVYSSGCPFIDVHSGFLQAYIYIFLFLFVSFFVGFNSSINQFLYFCFIYLPLDIIICFSYVLLLL